MGLGPGDAGRTDRDLSQWNKGNDFDYAVPPLPGRPAGAYVPRAEPKLFVPNLKSGYQK
jgi:hypothetical protein